MDKVIFKGEQLGRLIPQRAPIIMVDALFSADEEGAQTGLSIYKDNIFSDGKVLTEPGLIEHIAQSASAYAGYKAYKNNLPAPIGLIGEVKKFKVHKLPEIGTSVRTNISIISEVLNVTLIKGEVYNNDEIVASCQMKIFIKE